MALIDRIREKNLNLTFLLDDPSEESAIMIGNQWPFEEVSEEDYAELENIFGEHVDNIVKSVEDNRLNKIYTLLAHILRSPRNIYEINGAAGQIGFQDIDLDYYIKKDIIAPVKIPKELNITKKGEKIIKKLKKQLFGNKKVDLESFSDINFVYFKNKYGNK